MKRPFPRTLQRVFALLTEFSVAVVDNDELVTLPF